MAVITEMILAPPRLEPRRPVMTGHTGNAAVIAQGRATLRQLQGQQ